MHRAFTLVELLITLVIVGVVAAIAAPRFLSAGVPVRLDAVESRLQSEFLAASDLARSRGESMVIQVSMDLDVIRVYDANDRTRDGLYKTVKFAISPYTVDITGTNIADSDGYLLIDGHGMFEATAKITYETDGQSRNVTLDLPTAAAPVGGGSVGGGG